RLYEYVESPAGAAIVMELIDGVPVREILSRQGATTAEAALVVLQGSLLGLAAAHARGVVHRDYKPENVLIDGAGVSKLTDFGIAARAGDRPVPAGTLAYAPPEQFTGAPASPAGDVYAATATFYECLTGRPPFTGATTEALLAQHRSGPVPLDAVPGPLRPLVTAGMAKNPGDRPADAAAFVASLRAVAADAYGPDWEQCGRSHLAEAALLLAALWPSGAAPAVAGAAVEQVNLPRSSQAPQTPRAPQAPRESRHLWHLRHLWHEAHLGHLRRLRMAVAGTAAAAAVGAVAAVVVVTTGSSHSHPGAGTGGSPSLAKAASAAPEITSVRTYSQGVLVYFDIQYSDPGHDAEGFGFVGVKGARWAEENHPFTSPSYGIVGTDSISYPFNEGCGTAQHIDTYVQAWIYDTAGNRSTPVVIHLVCS
ncbi:MAG TPA: serine/threonine-protein kinase, partial [Streptosporangiaceae bacterium]|nr:serine/threonine-protein kinase [Streptosporangiaceae bacterium]